MKRKNERTKERKNSFLVLQFFSSSVGNGFTLAELLIAMSIFLVVTLITIMSFRSGEKVEQLRFAVENVAQEVRALQVFARTGQRQGSKVPKGGFGMQMLQCTQSPCTFIPFGDQNMDGRYAPNEQLPESITFAPRVILEKLETKDSGGIVSPRSGVVLIARSPYGDFAVHDLAGVVIPATELTLTFRQTELDHTRSLTINIPSGQIRRE
ncbi:prepilin-type N-terminal cleavage/methylation domain-containing protein [Candidatus Uhrbacteria bacterium]|nr:prepilin-type N-terminal cleavage/methylation domain-containing protein [Candidatus Uhrbacteria bacterium]